MRLVGGSTPTDGALLGTLPQEYRPAVQMVTTTHNLRGMFTVSTDGKVTISVQSGMSLNNYMGAFLSYPL